MLMEPLLSAVHFAVWILVAVAAVVVGEAVVVVVVVVVGGVAVVWPRSARVERGTVERGVLYACASWHGAEVHHVWVGECVVVDFVVGVMVAAVAAAVVAAVLRCSSLCVGRWARLVARECVRALRLLLAAVVCLLCDVWVVVDVGWWCEQGSCLR